MREGNGCSFIVVVVAKNWGQTYSFVEVGDEEASEGGPLWIHFLCRLVAAVHNQSIKKKLAVHTMTATLTTKIDDTSEARKAARLGVIQCYKPWLRDLWAHGTLGSSERAANLQKEAKSKQIRQCEAIAID